TKLSMLKDVLAPDNCAELLARAENLAEREVEALAQSLDPNRTPISAPRDSIRPLPGKSVTQSQNGKEPNLFSAAQPTSRPESETPSAPEDAVRHLLQMTVGPRFLELIERVRSAFSHTHPGAGLEPILEKCMEVALAEHARKNRSDVENPRPP